MLRLEAPFHLSGFSSKRSTPNVQRSTSNSEGGELFPAGARSWHLKRLDAACRSAWSEQKAVQTLTAIGTLACYELCSLFRRAADLWTDDYALEDHRLARRRDLWDALSYPVDCVGARA
jgi:hypothetical protein